MQPVPITVDASAPQQPVYVPVRVHIDCNCHTCVNARVAVENKQIAAVLAEETRPRYVYLSFCSSVNCSYRTLTYSYGHRSSSASGPRGAAPKPARVLYDFTSGGPGQMSIRAGEIINVTEQVLD